MKQEKLTDQEVHYIIGAFDIASGETDADYSDIKAKLFRMYPEVKAEIDDYAKRLQRASDKQDKRRKEITDVVVGDIDLSLPVLNQLKTWIGFEDNWTKLRNAYSDEICLAGDLWKYYFREMKSSGLIRELREILKKKGQERGNAWMKNYYKDTTDKDMWHELVRELEVSRR